MQCEVDAQRKDANATPNPSYAELPEISGETSATVVVAATQMSCTSNATRNANRAEKLVRLAYDNGANIILLQELFEALYFPQQQDPDAFALAHEREGHPLLERMGKLAAELGVVLPISFFERAGQTHFNSVVVFDADGTDLGLYRKSHIPDSPGYNEKFYFTPGDTGFKVFHTMYGTIGVGICWDQWFPEAARIMVLQGAELLFYPTAIGSEPSDPTLDSFPQWQRVMQGHAAANLVPVVASNRTGVERSKDDASQLTFYGGSFIAGTTGELLAQAPEDSDEAVIVAEVDLEAARRERVAWGVFRDRRPDLYNPILTHDGTTPRPR